MNNIITENCCQRESFLIEILYEGIGTNKGNVRDKRMFTVKNYDISMNVAYLLQNTV